MWVHESVGKVGVGFMYLGTPVYDGCHLGWLTEINNLGRCTKVSVLEVGPSRVHRKVCVHMKYCLYHRQIMVCNGWRR